MKFKVVTNSSEYLDDVPSVKFEYESSDLFDFVKYVESLREKVRELLNFDPQYLNTYQINVNVFVDDVLRGTEYFRRSETEKLTLTVWYVIHPLP